jgi:hypothetical protein
MLYFVAYNANHERTERITLSDGRSLQRTYVRNYEQMRRKDLNVSPLNRVYPRPKWVVRKHFERQERAAARCRKAYRWRVHQREMRRIRECANNREINHEEIKPVQQSTGVDFLRRKEGDECTNSTENYQTQSVTNQDGMDLSQ